MTVGSEEYDAFVDVSAAGLNRNELPHYLEALAHDAGLTGIPGRVTVFVPSNAGLSTPAADLGLRCVSGLSPSNLLYSALRRAAGSRRHLVVIVDALIPRNEVLQRLIEEFGRDAMFGTAQPRFADVMNDCVWPLFGGESNGHYPQLTRAGLANLPACTITSELASACIAIRREVVAEMDDSEHGFLSAIGELRFLLCQARRRGYRNVIVNQAVVPSQLPYSRLYPQLPDADALHLRTIYPDSSRADTWNAGLSQHRLEQLFARFCADAPTDRRRILLDCRGMPNRYNGTAHGMLGLLDGWHALDKGWQVDVLAAPKAADFHGLGQRYRKFKLVQEHPAGTYTAAVLLNQPWRISTVAELHECALLVVFNMLDTIKWDVLYNCDQSLDALWRFVARFSDGLLYNSEFTRDRFRARFPVRPGMAERVTYLSLSPEEYVNPAAARERVGEQIVIFGNEFDHKDVTRTARILADAFPLHKIVAFGLQKEIAPGIVSIPSGRIGEGELHRLIASARVVVFPSFYEGFGIPLLQGLAYGRAVVVRQSSLWDEIAARLRSSGQVVPFDGITSLVEAVGRTLHGLPLQGLPQGTALRADEPPLCWRDCALRVIDLLEELMSNPDGSRWQERQDALRAIELLRA